MDGKGKKLSKKKTMTERELCELTEDQLIALEQEINLEKNSRNSPGWNLSELTDQELEVLAQKVKEQKAKGMVINFHHYAISVHNFLKVIDVLKEKEKLLKDDPRPVTIRLAENYLEDSQVSLLCRCILESKIFKKHLVNLELNHNRFTKESLPLLKELVEKCPSLDRLDFSINCIDSQDFQQVFSSLPPELQKKVEFSVY